MTVVTRSDSPTHSAVTTKSSDRVLIAIFVLSLVMPFFFFLGGLRLSMYRLYLIVLAVPIMVRWMRGDADGIRAADVLVFTAAFWMMFTLFINHGVAEQLEFAGITFVETVVPYLIARVLIRDFAAFRTFVWWHFTAVMVLVPFALFENLTGRPILLDMFRGVFSVYHDANHEPRLGLERAQASLPHPILFGVFATPAITLSWYVLGHKESFFKQIRRPIIAGLAVFSSLSSGAYFGVALQVFLIAWDKILKAVKNRWTIFTIIFGFLYIVLEIASDRNMFQIIATELAFSPGTAWNRIHIFNNAIDDVYRNPIFGIGHGDWTRPSWMKVSIDNFWLVVALRFGVPAFFLMVLCIIIICWQIVRAPLSGIYAKTRIAYLIVLASLCVCASTVHLWDATYCLFMFFLGSGLWFKNADQTSGEVQAAAETGPGRRTIQYTRFPKSPPGGSV